MKFIKLVTNGLWGFAVFFSVILFTKLFLYISNISISLNIEVIDLYHSLVGMVLFILASMSKQIIKNYV
ncbi:MAG: hypothetical protein KDC88_04815 [Ignavibacteriae bacterium]|nr:hypothetical protein [Ignavibacteriota bacterium]MCB9208565.1 hypothetical protein [Ignavibacteriales bacterium]MCB9258325.1 hypothetical protein [Ignavibacteriales bacterium]